MTLEWRLFPMLIGNHPSGGNETAPRLRWWTTVCTVPTAEATPLPFDLLLLSKIFHGPRRYHRPVAETAMSQKDAEMEADLERERKREASRKERAKRREDEERAALQQADARAKRREDEERAALQQADARAKHREDEERAALQQADARARRREARLRQERDRAIEEEMATSVQTVKTQPSRGRKDDSELHSAATPAAAAGAFAVVAASAIGSTKGKDRSTGPQEKPAASRYVPTEDPRPVEVKEQFAQSSRRRRPVSEPLQEDDIDVVSILDKYNVPDLPMSEYFKLPEELSEQSNALPKAREPSFVDEEQLSDIPEIVTVAPPESGGYTPEMPSTPSDAHDDPLRLSYRSYPWTVPTLKVISPTPPPRSIRSSFSEEGDASPRSPNDRFAEKDAEPVSNKLPSTRADPITSNTSNKDNSAARSPPEEEPEIAIVEISPKPKAKPQAEREPRDTGKPKAIPELTRKSTLPHVPGEFVDDVDFAATLAAGLEDTGFDPAIVLDDDTYRRRSTPPGSEDPAGQRGFNVPPADEKRERASGEGGRIPAQGFVERGVNDGTDNAGANPRTARGDRDSSLERRVDPADKAVEHPSRAAEDSAAGNDGFSTTTGKKEWRRSRMGDIVGESPNETNASPPARDGGAARLKDVAASQARKSDQPDDMDNAEWPRKKSKKKGERDPSQLSSSEGAIANPSNLSQGIPETAEKRPSAGRDQNVAEDDADRGTMDEPSSFEPSTKKGKKGKKYRSQPEEDEDAPLGTREQPVNGSNDTDPDGKVKGGAKPDLSRSTSTAKDGSVDDFELPGKKGKKGKKGRRHQNEYDDIAEEDPGRPDGDTEFIEPGSNRASFGVKSPRDMDIGAGAVPDASQSTAPEGGLDDFELPTKKGKKGKKGRLQWHDAEDPPPAPARGAELIDEVAEAVPTAKSGRSRGSEKSGRDDTDWQLAENAAKGAPGDDFQSPGRKRKEDNGRKKARDLEYVKTP
ncbi:MAG: hypothetical protein M1826_000488 [Phylliscum demangeonii]|nr:MAG: hypothetical protein M1826_000488 [Phylliscum demangeonii]